jgi:hypothetical protein
MWGSIVGSIAQVVGSARPDVVEISRSLGPAGLPNRMPDLTAG